MKSQLVKRNGSNEVRILIKFGLVRSQFEDLTIAIESERSTTSILVFEAISYNTTS